MSTIRPPSLKRGWLEKRCGRFGVWQPRYLVLQGDQLSWYFTQNVKSGLPEGTVNLKDANISQEGLALTFHGTEEESFRAPDEGTLKDWLTLLRHQLANESTSHQPQTKSPSAPPSDNPAIAQETSDIYTHTQQQPSHNISTSNAIFTPTPQQSGSGTESSHNEHNWSPTARWSTQDRSILPEHAQREILLPNQTYPDQNFTPPSSQHQSSWSSKSTSTASTFAQPVPLENSSLSTSQGWGNEYPLPPPHSEQTAWESQGLQTSWGNNSRSSFYPNISSQPTASPSLPPSNQPQQRSGSQIIPHPPRVEPSPPSSSAIGRWSNNQPTWTPSTNVSVPTASPAAHQPPLQPAPVISPYPQTQIPQIHVPVSIPQGHTTYTTQTWVIRQPVLTYPPPPMLPVNPWVPQPPPPTQLWHSTNWAPPAPSVNYVNHPSWPPTQNWMPTPLPQPQLPPPTFNQPYPHITNPPPFMTQGSNDNFTGNLQQPPAFPTGLSPAELLESVHTQKMEHERSIEREGSY